MDQQSHAVVFSDAQVSRIGTRVGYVVTIIVDAALLFVANNILAWGWIPWLTDGFTEVLPILNVSLIATMVVNAVYLFYDPRWFKSLCEIGLLAISIAVTVTLYRVFPFDFSDTAWNWDAITRVILVLLSLAMAAAIVGQAVALVRSVRPDSGAPSAS